jgi:hypothetical protein
MVPGQRYLFLSYGPLSTSGVFSRLVELSPGVTVIEVEDAVAIGETGDIGMAQQKQVYEPNQSGPLHGVVLIPWHDVSKILVQGP